MKKFLLIFLGFCPAAVVLAQNTQKQFKFKSR